MSLLSSAVSAVTGTVASAADTLTGTSTSTTDSSDSSTTTTTTTTSAPATTTATPTSTTATPATTTATPTTTTATPTATTVTPTATTATPTTSSSSGSAGSATTSSASSTGTSVAAESTPTASSSAASTSSTGSVGTSSQSSSSDSASGYTWGETNSLRGDSASASQEVVVVTESEGLSTGAIVGIVLSAVVIVLLLAGLVFWFYRREKRKRDDAPPLTDHRSALAVGGSTDRAQSSDPTPKGMFAPFHTANLDTSSSSAGSSNRSAGEPWEDPDITAMRIPLEKLSVGSLLNQGGHGAVYRGVYRGQVVAVKKLLPETRKDMREINIFLAEIKLMATIEHPRVVRFIGVGWDSLSDLSAVSEFMEGGDLYRLLKHFDQMEHRDHGFDLQKARIALHVAHALTYLHSLEPVVVHRDLKSLNILLSRDLEAKITDFGVSRKWTVETMTAGVGTFLWMAPEVMAGKRYDASADIFSFGIVLSELDSHLPPYSSVRETRSGQKISDTALMELVTSGQLRVEFSPKAPKAVVDLGHACVHLNPAKRPSARDLLYRLQGILRMYESYTI